MCYTGTTRNKVLTQAKPAALVVENESYDLDLPAISRKPKVDKKSGSRNDVMMYSDSDSDDTVIKHPG